MGKRARIKKQRAAEREKARAIVRLYARVAAEVLPRHFEKRCCLNGTRVALEVLKHFGVEATPLATKAAAFNQLMFERIVADGSEGLSSPPEVVDQWVAEGAWSVGVGHPGAEGDGWNGHLVALAAGLIVDSSSGQFARPEKQIVAELVTVHPHKRDFAQGASALIPNDFGTVLWYMPEPGRRDFINRPGFQRSPHNLEAAAEIIEKMKAVKERDHES
jgi:hypothetical protein